MVLWSLALTVLTTYLIGRYTYYFSTNLIAARKTGLHYIISPLTPYTLHWQLATSLLRPVLIKFRWFRAIDWTCCWRDGNTLHAELGGRFLVVSPGLIVLCTDDIVTVDSVLKDWRQYVKPDNVNEILGTFGRNVDTSNGDDWPRHRKLVAPCFTERASSTVWSLALQQADDMVNKWLAMPDGVTNTLIRDTGTLALNVISSIAFENTKLHEPSDGYTLSLRDALVIVMSTSISPVLESVLPWLKTSRLAYLLPAKITRLLTATREFNAYMNDLIARERAKPPPSPASDSKTHLNLIQTLINAKNSSDGKTARLSDDELRGNIFIFTAGGLESTGTTLSYALALLALNPGVQEWVAEEVRGVVGDGKGELEYGDVFLRLGRVRAVMFETLRTHGPSPPLPRTFHIPSMPFTLPTSTSNPSSLISLPPATQIMLNSWSTHTSPQYFPDPLTWNPKRWIDPISNDLIHPSLGKGFWVWGSGPRVCPGRVFSQVEFCAVLVGVVGRVEVSVLGAPGGRQRMEAALRASVADPLLLRVEKPEGVWVRVSRR